jgi:hypothetical protein
MTLFAVAMVGLATAQDLVLLFVFFDLTAVCSYYLIGFDRGRREARTAALTAGPAGHRGQRGRDAHRRDVQAASGVAVQVVEVGERSLCPVVIGEVEVADLSGDDALGGR